MILKGIPCTMCGTLISSIPATEPGFEDRGHVSDRLLLCTAHRKVTATLLGESACQSPGRGANVGGRRSHTEVPPLASSWHPVAGAVTRRSRDAETYSCPSERGRARDAGAGSVSQLQPPRTVLTCPVDGTHKIRTRQPPGTSAPVAKSPPGRRHPVSLRQDGSRCWPTPSSLPARAPPNASPGCCRRSASSWLTAPGRSLNPARTAASPS